MLNLSDAHHFRKTVAGICMILAPVLFLIAAIVAPSSDNDAGAILAAISEHRDAFYLSTVLAIAGSVLLLPALLGLMHMLRERQVAYGHVGGGLALLGNMMLMLLLGTQLMQWQMVRGGGRADMVALLDRFGETTGSAIFVLLTLALTLGLVVLALGLYRARAVPWSTALALVVGAVVLQVAFFAVSTAAWYIVASAILLVAFVSIGRMVLAETDEEWEHTPEHRGFRPAATH
jgi:hypothetical protein